MKNNKLQDKTNEELMETQEKIRNLFVLTCIPEFIMNKYEELMREIYSRENR